MSWPSRLSSAASVLSRRQLPQYIRAAPAVNARIFIAESVHALHHALLQPAEGAHVANPVPGIFQARRLPLRFIALQKARHEKLASQCGEPHPPVLAVRNDEAERE